MKNKTFTQIVLQTIWLINAFYEVKSVLSLKEKKHNIDFPTLKLPTSTKNLL